uniref:Uncharacterized protein n=1 Tax=Esox lucius TaxID=8010 RepID=A0AAY5K4L4_ESOLU
MQDIALSLLSRGCGQVVQSQLGCQDGRLEVCFEPEDYYLWKSQPSLLRVSQRGHLLDRVDPVPPKTYSTRRGPLFLYYEDMATSYTVMSSGLSSCPAESEVNRKKRASQHSRQEEDIQLNTLRDLTGAILAYGNKQLREEENQDAAQHVLPLPSKHEPRYAPLKPSYPRHPTKGGTLIRSSWNPQVGLGHKDQLTCQSQSGDLALCSPRDPCSPTSNRQRSGPVHTDMGKISSSGPVHTDMGKISSSGPVHTDMGKISSSGPVHTDVGKISSETTDEGASGLEGQEDGQRRVRFQVMGEIPRVQMSPYPKKEPLWRVESTRHLPGGQDAHQEMRRHGNHPEDRGDCEMASEEKPWAIQVGERSCSLKTASVDSTWKSSKLSHINYYGGHLGGGQVERTRGGADPRLKKHQGDHAFVDASFSGPHLPPLVLGPLVSLLQDKPSQKPGSPGRPVESLPPIKSVEVSSQAPTQPRFERLIQTYPAHPAEIYLAAEFLPDRGHPERGHPDRGHPDRGHPDRGHPDRGHPGVNPDRSHLEKPEPGRLLLSFLLPPGHTEEDKQSPCARRGARGGLAKRGVAERRGGAGQEDLPEEGIKQTGLEEDRDGLFILEPDQEHAVPLGVIAPLVGRLRGPGKQSSMAVYRDRPELHAQWDHSDSGRAVVRGSLPLELRDWQQRTGKALGTLIMGPDGEVMQMSLWDPANVADVEATGLDQASTDHALKGLTTEGKGPWVELMQTKPTTTGESSKGSGANMKLTGLVQRLVGSHRQTNPPEDKQLMVGVEGDMAAVRYNLCSSSVNIRREEDEKVAWEGNDIRCTEELEGRGHDGDQPSPQNSGISNELTRGELIQNISQNPPLSTDTATGHSHKLPESTDTATGHSHKPPETTDTATGHSHKPPESTDTGPGHSHKPPESTDTAPGHSHKPPESTETATGHSHKPPESTDTAPGHSYKPPESTDTAPGHSHKPLSPTLSGHSTEVAKTPSQDRNRNQSEDLLASSSKGGHFKNAHVTVDKQKKRGPKQETDDKGQSRPEPLEDTFNEETELQSSPAGPITKKKRVKGEEQRGLPKENGKASRKRKDRVKGQAEFVVGKPKGQRAEKKIQETRGTEERSAPSLDGGGTAIRQQWDNLFSETEGEEPMDRVHSHTSNYSSVNRNSSTNEQSCQISVKSTSCVEEVQHYVQQHSSHDQLSSHSVVMAAENQSLNLVISDTNSNTDKNRESVADYKELQTKTLAEKDIQKKVLAEKAERRRLEVERKRKEKEEERRKQQEQEEREEKIRIELEEEQKQRAEDFRRKRQDEEEKRRRLEEEEVEKRRREQVEKERERRRKEEKKRQLEIIQKIRQEEEERRAAEVERHRLQEVLLKEEEEKMLAEMKENERIEYLKKQKVEEEVRRRAEEERRAREQQAALWAKEEARRQVELFERQRAALEQQLRFRRGLLMEAGALGQAQDISRPWVYSYFQLLQLLGLATGQKDSPKNIGATDQPNVQTG